VSGREMSQISDRLSWTFEEVDGKLKDIMEGIYAACAQAAEQYGKKGDIQAGANIAGFLKVADAMLWQGVC
ncbi:MAG: NADP-specific glutamate dehydrogenase, partial [Oscillospiraceae bacterium]|nr:NADP-specific glutamate dehydrogenase [Oscillospiraceae bacterium]